MTAARTHILEEVSRLEQNRPAARVLDLPRMRRLAENWPSEGGHHRAVPARSAAWNSAIFFVGPAGAMHS